MAGKARTVLIVAVVALVVGIWQLAGHGHTASTLAAKITSDDAASIDTTADQQALMRYTKAHMTTSRTIFLTASYSRANQAAQAAANPTSNGAVYAAAQASCASHADSLVQARCVQAYLSAHSTTGTNPQAATPPAEADYIKAFPSPIWTADSAGIPLAIAVVGLALGGYLTSRRQV